MAKSKVSRRLNFGYENAKLQGQGIFHFSLPSGHSCPGALACMAKADQKTGRVTDGPRQEFRCFEAATESRFANVRDPRWMNFKIMKSRAVNGNAEVMRQLLNAALPPLARIVRIHIGGDFFSQAYFDAWRGVAEDNPKVRFYGYTKSLNLWVERLLDMPENLVLTASKGGRYDHLIELHCLRSVQVVMHPEEAAALNLEIDHDDTHAQVTGDDFALLLHSVGPAGSKHNAAIKGMKAEGVEFSYPRKSRDAVFA